MLLENIAAFVNTHNPPLPARVDHEAGEVIIWSHATYRCGRMVLVAERARTVLQALDILGY